MAYGLKGLHLYLLEDSGCTETTLHERLSADRPDIRRRLAAEPRAVNLRLAMRPVRKRVAVTYIMHSSTWVRRLGCDRFCLDQVWHSIDLTTILPLPSSPEPPYPLAFSILTPTPRRRVTRPHPTTTTYYSLTTSRNGHRCARESHACLTTITSQLNTSTFHLHCQRCYCTLSSFSTCLYPSYFCP